MPNRLAQETSPYLQQHAGNPVDWYPWGEEALERARREDKPILLSVGYSACHWCHVMAHESFEDPGVAAVMNALFVNVKVDREERPDLDQIYQLAHQMMARRAGGWPLTVFLTPGQVPFYTGTYFPKEPRFGLPGFAGICERIAQAWQTQRAEIEKQNGAVLKAIGQYASPASSSGADFSDAPLRAALVSLKGTVDWQNGGFGSAPKFPHPAELELLLRHHAATGDDEALKAVTLTLERMALGGIFDQLGGGFARYSVDATWTIPHFEKMLYDNGPLLRLYADTWCVNRNPLFARIVEETAGWMMREMQSPEGGYYSSLDADSEHEEGKFYVWDREEIRSLVSPEEYQALEAHYGLQQPPNFENRHWNLNVVLDVQSPQLASARRKLFEARERRVHPGRDDKILTSWNALAIQGMARAGRVFGREDWIESAERAFSFVRQVLWQDGRLLATFKDGRAHLNAYLDDYGYLLAAALELLQARFDAGRLRFATALGDALLERFEDTRSGGFYFTSHDHESLIARMKPLADNATPSGNGTAALALLRLSFITGEARFEKASRRALEAALGAMHDTPAAHASLLMALEEHLRPTRTIILRGEAGVIADWQARLSKRHLPHTVSLAIPQDAHDIPEVLAKPVLGVVNAWVCEGVTCLPAIDDYAELESRVFNQAQSG